MYLTVVSVCEMVRQIRIEFEKGGVFLAALMEDAAPRACKQIWEALPIKSRAGQAARSGQVLNCAVPFEHRIVENSKLVIPQGGLALDGKLYKSLYREGQPIIKAAIVIAYGVDNMSFGYSGLVNPISYFAQIKDGLDELYKIGLRNREYGRENVAFSKAA
jgi:hypothetical protein